MIFPREDTEAQGGPASPAAKQALGAPLPGWATGVCGSQVPGRPQREAMGAERSHHISPEDVAGLPL